MQEKVEVPNLKLVLENIKITIDSGAHLAVQGDMSLENCYINIAQGSKIIVENLTITSCTARCQGHIGV